MRGIQQSSLPFGAAVLAETRRETRRTQHVIASITPRSQPGGTRHIARFALTVLLTMGASSALAVDVTADGAHGANGTDGPSGDPSGGAGGPGEAGASAAANAT